MSRQAPTCRCGHKADAHEHLRRGTDCALCGPTACAHFTPAGGGRSILARLTALVHRSRPGASVVEHPTVRGRRPARPGDGDHAREA